MHRMRHKFTKQSMQSTINFDSAVLIKCQVSWFLSLTNLSIWSASGSILFFILRVSIHFEFLNELNVDFCDLAFLSDIWFSQSFLFIWTKKKINEFNDGYDFTDWSSEFLNKKCSLKIQSCIINFMKISQKCKRLKTPWQQHFIFMSCESGNSFPLSF